MIKAKDRVEEGGVDEFEAIAGKNPSSGCYLGW